MRTKTLYISNTLIRQECSHSLINQDFGVSHSTYFADTSSRQLKICTCPNLYMPKLDRHDRVQVIPASNCFPIRVTLTSRKTTYLYFWHGLVHSSCVGQPQLVLVVMVRYNTYFILSKETERLNSRCA
jgi:hypothetical protein